MQIMTKFYDAPYYVRQVNHNRVLYIAILSNTVEHAIMGGGGGGRRNQPKKNTDVPLLPHTVDLLRNTSVHIMYMYVYL